MPDTYQSYRTFIASPSDVAKERDLAEATIARLNRALRDTLKLSIDVRKWEHEIPLASNLPQERLQDRLLREVEQAHFFILILYRRYGTIEPGQSVSNTEREINAILDGYAKGRRRQVLAYFRDLPRNSDAGKQEAKVRQLRERLSELGLPWRPYRTAAEFNEHLAPDLYEVVLKIRLSPFKQQALNSFWRFGESGRPHVPRVAIVFPLYDRESLRAGQQGQIASARDVSGKNASYFSEAVSEEKKNS